MSSHSASSPLRLSTLLGILISMASQMFWWSTPAHAQSFLQQLFGISPAPQARQMPPTARMPAPRPITSITVHTFPRTGNFNSPAREVGTAAEGSGSYTTVCVRMCDGFHFPVSNRVPRSRFHRDADICRSRCGMAEARLFYYPSSGPNADMKSAVDLTGRSYAQLPIAFLHRKKLVSGCGCRPEAWSQASAIRHEGYAVAAGKSIPGTQQVAATLSIVAGNYPDNAPDPENTSGGSLGEGSPPAASNGVPAQTADADQQSAEQPASPTTLITAAKNPGRPARTALPSTRRDPAARSAQKSSATGQPPKKPPNVVMASSGKYVWPGDVPTRTR
jgi:hypothetical protein